MAKALLLVWSSPASPEAAGEYADWYDNTHVPEVRAAIPSITTVNRYVLAGDDGAPSTTFLAVYELDDDDVTAASAALTDAANGGRLHMSTAIDTTGHPPLQWLRHVSA